jgi:hypothetical protein
VDSLRNQWAPLGAGQQPGFSDTGDLWGVFTGHELIEVDRFQMFRYHLASDTWTAGAAPPDVWAGAWAGGRLLAVASNSTSVVHAWSPATDAWTAINAAGAPSYRDGATSFWTGSELWIFGGSPASGAAAGNDGARFKPSGSSGGTWTAIPPIAAGAPLRTGHTALWTGTELLVWGGKDPRTGLLVEGGARYDGSRWSAMSSAGAPSARQGHSAVWTGSKLIVWGGADGAFKGLADGKIYLPAEDRWVAMAAPPISARYLHTAIWTGSRMIVWGGYGDGAASAWSDGAIYNPATDAWVAASGAGSPTARGGHAAKWTGTGMLVFGGSLPNWGALNTLDVLR